MKNTIIILCLLLYPFLYLFSQINISLDNNCLKYNSATIAKVMIRVLGEDSIKQMLDKNTNVTFICKVDSFGYTSKIIRTFSRQDLSTNFMSLIEDYLVNNNVRFFICYQNNPPYLNKDTIINSVRKKFKKNNSLKIGSVSFPGELMNLYEYEKTRENNFCLSKYDYLLIQINKFTGNVN